MKYDRYDRRAIGRLSKTAAKVFRVIESRESITLVGVPALCDSLEQPVISFVGFSCAYGDTEGEKRLAVDKFGFFDKKVLKKVTNLFNEVRECGRKINVRIIVDDLEFRRAWGWTKSQQELTDECWLAMEIAKDENRVPPGELCLWSSLEPKAVEAGCVSYEDMLRWAEETEQSLVLRKDMEYRMTFPRHRTTKLSDLRPTSVQRLASYALQGVALEMLFPGAILLQTEAMETDWLYGQRRSGVLPIVHL